MVTIFDLFTIGVGPSSSHTIGVMRAAKAFVDSIQNRLKEVVRIEITLYDSLAATGIGHGTDKAAIIGLTGETPEEVNRKKMGTVIEKIKKSKKLSLLNRHEIDFDKEKDITFEPEKNLKYHPNGIRFTIFSSSGKKLESALYYSIGGGFIVSEKEIKNKSDRDDQTREVPYPFKTAKELLDHCINHQKSIAEIILANESADQSETAVKTKLLHIADTMSRSIKRGILSQEKVLPSILKIKRRAPLLYKRLKDQEKLYPANSNPMIWVNLYALAVTEENAAGGVVVTAPTNGASGILPAVLGYYKHFCKPTTKEGVINFLLTAGGIALLYKQNASISAAEMGCQAEVGVACSMAAAGLTAALGGTIYQVENAAEIGMEHNLGLTCDPISGLVQIPCIERNAVAAVKAVNIAHLALLEDGIHQVSLDMVMAAMSEIGRDMNSKYRETALGGLATTIHPLCQLSTHKKTKKSRCPLADWPISDITTLPEESY